MPGDTGRDRGSADGGDGGANDSGDDRGRDNDGGYGGYDGDDSGYGGMSEADAEAAGDALAGAADVADALAGWGRQSYGDLNESPDVADVFGFDRSARGIASGLANLGMSDQSISEALANWGATYSQRAPLVGPIDAITQGPMTRALSSGVSKAVAMSNPMAGLLGGLADRGLRGSLTGDYGDIGSALGGFAGSRFGAMIGGDLSQSIGGALAGLAAGGLAGSAFGRAIGSGQGSMSNVADLSSEGRDQSQAVGLSARQPQQRQTMMRPSMSPGLALQLLGMRGFGV